MAQDEPQLLNVQKAAAYLGVSPSAIRQWAVSSKLKGIKIGSRGDWRFTKEELSKMTKLPVEPKKLAMVKQFLLTHTEAVEKEATKDHLKYLGPEYVRIEAVERYMTSHIRILEQIIQHIEDTSLERASKLVKKSGENLAQNAIKDGLTIQEAMNGIIFLKQAILKKIKDAGLLHDLTIKDYHHLNFTIGTLIDAVSSQIAFAFSMLQRQQDEAEKYRLNKLFIEAPAFICTLRGKDHVYELSNDLHYQLVGFRDIIGKPVREALPEMVDQGIIKLLDTVLNTGQPFIGNEMKVQLQRTKNGPMEERYLNFVYQPLLEANGKYSGIFVHGVDVTDQVLARKKVEESEQKYRTLFNSIDEGFCVIEVLFDNKNKPVDYRFLEANPVFEKQTGLKKVLGRTAKELVPNLEDRWFELYGNVALTGKPHRFIEGSDAMGRWFDVYAFRIGDANSHKVALLFTDITERRLNEGALRAARDESERSKRLYEAVTASTPDLIYVFDLKCRFTYANKALLTMWGKSWDEAIGKGLRENGYEEWHAAMHEREIDQVVATKKPVRGQVSFPHATLGKRIYDYIIVPVINKKGDVEAVAGTTRDITELKRTEEALRLTQLRYTKLFESNVLGIFVPGFDGCVYEANDVFLKMIGYTKKDLKNKKIHWDTMTPPEYSKIDKEKINELLTTGQATPWEKEYIRKDGSRVPVLLGVVIVDEAEKRGLGFALDITERRKLERQKDEFIGIASHELKTPVTSIKVYAQLLQRKFRTTADVSSAEMVDKMNTQLDKLTNLIADLLDVTKIQGGKLQFHESNFEFNALVEEVIEEMQRTTEKHTIIKKFAKTTSLYGDKDRIGQVITNFLSNAIKYSPDSKDIIVRTIVKDNLITLSVQDFGKGIAKEDHPKIFDRFYRVSGTGQETFPGLGLGLYISSEIIKRQGGRIWVEAEKGKGSTFCFSLPLK